MTEELKPCPFCGSTKVYLHEDDDGVGSQVYCRSCHAMMDNLGTPDENIEAWNRRVKNKEGFQYMNIDKYKRGFTVTGKHRIETTDWILSRDSMSDNFLQFLAYDANLYPTPDFSTWKDNKFKQKQIKKALEFTKDFYGEVWLDDVKIKEKQK